MLSFSLAGDGEIDLSLVAKKPGPGLDLDHAHAAIPLSSLAGADPLPPYVRLIHDVLIGDRSLFTRPDGLAAVWKVVDPAADQARPRSRRTRPAPGARRRPASSSRQAAGCSASNLGGQAELADQGGVIPQHPQGTDPRPLEGAAPGRPVMAGICTTDGSAASGASTAAGPAGPAGVPVRLPRPLQLAA